MNCPRCYSDKLTSIAADFPTGVQMNGYRETRYQEGFQCERCGLMFESDDVLDEMPQWSITPSGEVFYIAN